MAAKKTAKDATSPTVERIHYIAAPIRRVWKALTDGKETPNYYFDLKLEGSTRKGGRWSYSDYEGNATIEGKLVKIVKEKELVHTFAFPGFYPKDKPTRVRYTLESLGPKLTALNMSHTGFRGRTGTYTSVEGGWDQLLCSLKTYVETGQGIAFDSD